jgi:hypothetical protein
MSDDGALTEAAREYAAAASPVALRWVGSMNKPQVFVSYDIERDEGLFEELRTQSSSAGFAVLGCSERQSAADVWSEKVRRRIREADQVIFICSEHTEASVSMSNELRIAQQEQTPYFLLWGRREIMCTKPVGAKSAEGMYSWTRQVLQDQIAITSRSAHTDAIAETLRSSWKG